MGASAGFSNATASELFPTERRERPWGLGQRNDKDAPKGQAGRNHFVRKLLTGGIIAALALAGAFAVARIVTPTSQVISCASPPVYALRPATRSCIREPTVKLRGES
jgi:hypothetical protein